MRAPDGARAGESDEARASMRTGAPYAQPTPRILYVHDDLTDEVSRRFGPASPAAALVRVLFALIGREGERVRVLTLSEQLDRVVAQGPHPAFDLALAIGSAGERRGPIHPRARPPGFPGSGASGSRERRTAAGPTA